MGKGTGKGGLDVVEAFSSFILYISYGLYVAIGIILLAVTIFYVSEIDGTSDFLKFGLGISSFSMLFVGGVALFATFKQMWPILAVVELINVALFGLILAAMVISFCLAMDMSDPVRDSVDRSWELTRWKEDLWATRYCSRHVVSCNEEAGFKKMITASLAAAGNTYPMNTQGSNAFANCSMPLDGEQDNGDDSTVCAFTAADTTTDPTAPTAAFCAVTSGPGACAVTAAVESVLATVCAFTAADTTDTTTTVNASCAVASGPGACAVNDAGTGCDGDADAVAASQPATCDVTSVAGTIASCAVTSGPGSCALNGDSTGCDGAADAVAGPASDASCAVASGPGTCLVNADGTDGCTGATDAVAMGSTTAASDASCAVASGTGTCLVNADSTACDATDTAVCTFTIAQVADPAAATEATVCTFTAAVVPADATVCAFTAADESSGSIPTSEVIEAQCILCNEECRESLITHMGDYSLPVLYGVCGTFFFTMIAIFCNAGQLTHDEPPGWVRLLSMNMNGLTSLCGLIMAILGTYAQYTIADECPADADCTNYVAVVIIILGVGLFVTGGIGLGGAFKHLTPLLFVVNIIELVFALMLFIAGIFLAIIAGAMDTVNSQSDEHFDVLRAQYEQRYPNYCSNLGPPVTPMSEIDCRAKIAEDVESNLLIVGIIGLIVAAYFAVVIFFTYHCIQHMREDGKDNDDELDEEALDSELESTE